MMKKNFLILSLLLAGAVSFVQCSDDDSPEIETDCLPKVLPVEGGVMTLTYNGAHQVTDISFENYDEPETNYTMDIEYSGEEVARVNFYEDDILTSFKVIEGDDNTIIESDYSKNEEGEFQEFERYVYYLDNNDRIKGRTHHDYYNDFMNDDSVVYTYNGAGNISRVDKYGDDNVVDYTNDITYDDRINPHHVSGIPYGDNEFFDEFNLSANNPTKAIYTEVGDGSTEQTSITYTYDSNKKPVTRKFSWQDRTTDITWTCH